MFRITVLILVFIATLVGASSLRAASKPYYIGESWEEALERGVDGQRQQIRRRVTPENVLGRAARAARRDPSVVNLYLLARAHGLRADWHRQTAKAARNEGMARRSLQKADVDHAEALAVYRDVLAKAPRCYFAWHDMGVLELQQDAKAVGKAFGNFSRAYRINDRYTPTQRQLIQLYLLKKQFGVAIPLIQALLEFDPGDDDARARLVSAYAALERYDAAFRELDALMKKKGSDLQLLALRAHLDTKSGNYSRAMATYRRLARINPNVAIAYNGILACLANPEARKLPSANDDYLFALKGLLRLERDPNQRKKIEEDIRRLEHMMSQPKGATQEGPPTTDQLLHMLESPDVEQRKQALLWLAIRPEKPTAEVLRAMLGHISPQSEASPAARAVAVGALGRMGGSGLVPVIRLTLSDPDVRVRVHGVDTLAAIAMRDVDMRQPVTLILGQYVADKDTEAASAARLAILSLNDVSLQDVGEDSTDADHRRAFQAWWRGAEAEELLIEALQTYNRVADRRPDQVLVAYLNAREFFVFKTAYGALGAAAAGATDPAWKRWYSARPQFDAAQMKKENWGALKAAVDAWVSKRPGA